MYKIILHPVIFKWNDSKSPVTGQKLLFSLGYVLGATGNKSEHVFILTFDVQNSANICKYVLHANFCFV